MAKARSTGHRYRRVPIARWRDPRVIKLSDAAFRLFEYLTTGPATGIIPGLSCVSLGTIEDDLRRDRRTVRKALDEILAAGLAQYDPEARLFWRMECVEEQPPEAPSNIQGWDQTWRELPPCTLLDTARAYLASYCESRGPDFQRAGLEGEPLRAVLSELQIAADREAA